MELRPFSTQVAQARERIAALEEGHSVTRHDADALLWALEELRTAFEELGAAEEGLREQHDALLAAQEEVSAERQRYRELFDFAPDAYLITNLHGIIQEANQAAGKLLGTSPRLLRGFPLPNFMAPEQQRMFREQMRAARASEAVTEWDCTIQPRHSQAVQAAIRVAVVRDAAYRPTGLRWLLRDITERQRAAAAEIKLMEEQAARERAEATAKERETVLAVAAHELKTPLSTILGYAQFVRERCLRSRDFTERDADALATVAYQAQRLSNQIDAMLDVGRISTGQFSIVRQPLDFVALAQRITEWLAPTLHQHTLRSILPDTQLLVAGDSTHLEQMLYNLIGNAAKYSPKGGTISLTVTQRDQAACIAVADQGIGIAEADINHLFERFYRAHGQENDHIRGLGIGLYVVREIVRAHDGTISVASREGEGSTFTVCLPLLQT